MLLKCDRNQKKDLPRRWTVDQERPTGVSEPSLAVALVVAEKSPNWAILMLHRWPWDL